MLRFPNEPKIPTAAGLTLNSTEAAAFRAIAAQNFVSGNVLGWFGTTSSWANTMGLKDSDAAFVRLLAGIRARHPKFLTFGRLWRRPKWVVPPLTMPLHDYGYMEHDPTQSCPTSFVLVECWLSGDGNYALAVANHAETPMLLDVEVDLGEPGKPSRDSTIRVNQTIPALSARMISISPQTSTQV